MKNCERNRELAACVQWQVGDQVNTVKEIIILNAAHIHTDHDMAGINDSGRGMKRVKEEDRKKRCQVGGKGGDKNREKRRVGGSWRERRQRRER